MVLGPSRLCLLLEQVSKAFSKRMAPKTIIDTRYWIFGCTGRIELSFGRLWFLFRDLCKSPFLLRISNFGYKTAPAPPLTLQVNIVASAVFRSKFEMLVDESDFCRGPLTTDGFSALIACSRSKLAQAGLCPRAIFRLY